MVESQLANQQWQCCVCVNAHTQHSPTGSHFGSTRTEVAVFPLGERRREASVLVIVNDLLFSRTYLSYQMEKKIV